MKKIFNYVLILIMLITSVVYLIYSIKIGNYEKILPCLSIILVVSIPKILNRFNFDLTENEKVIYYLFIFIAHFLGAVLNFYTRVWFFDLFAHTLSGILSFMLGLKILKGSNYKIELNLFNITFLLGFCFLIAGGWEIIEFLGDKILNANFQHSIETGVNDTMEDILCAFVGYIISFTVYFILNRKNS